MATSDLNIGSFTSYNFQENLIISSFSTYSLTQDQDIGSIGQFYADQDVGSIGQFYSDLSIGTMEWVRIYERRFSIMDNIKLRHTDVYSSPPAIEPLLIAFGNKMESRVPCTQIDSEGKYWHVSDRPIQIIGDVYEGDELTKKAHNKFNAYKDETGNSIAVIEFQEKAENVSCACKGVVDDDGYLIENPAKLIRYLFFNIQGYENDTINYKSYQLLLHATMNYDIKLAGMFEYITIKQFLDKMAENIYALWNITDGKFLMRLLYG